MDPFSVRGLIPTIVKYDLQAIRGLRLQYNKILNGKK
jgi:hypothetical protein